MQSASTLRLHTWLWASLAAAAVSLQGATAMAAERKLVIAHRGASGYLPEHTLAGKALAYAMGADYLEQDLVATRDKRLIVLHDIHLDTVTDVAKAFPGRARDDGRYYALDFSLAEIRRLQVFERFDRRTGKPVFPGRFPQGKSRFRVPTFEEELELIGGLNQTTGRQVGIYPEIKAPHWHRQQGVDISHLTLAALARFGYRTKRDRVFLQCFDPGELKRIRGELDCKLRLVQLIGENSWHGLRADHEKLRTVEGLAGIARYADGIGPRIEHLLAPDAQGKGAPRVTDLVRNAHRLGLQVHPYTHRADALPHWADNDSQKLLSKVLLTADADGLFSDFPDQVVRFLSTNGTR